MQIQKSFQQPKPTLFLVGTPIGNLSDMTPRAIETLKSVTLIASEDTRVTKKLCNHFSIETPLTSYHEHNKHQKTELILNQLATVGDVALVSDAGLPLISDPGDQLVNIALASNFSVVPIPGANAALTALIASGLAPQPFLFYGFLERQKSKKKAELLTLSPLSATLIFYESPHRIKETLLVMLDVFGNRQVVIARELTKMFEEFLRGSIEDVVDSLDQVKGEVVLVVEGGAPQKEESTWWEHLTLHEHVAHYLGQGMKPNAAIKQTASDLERPRQDVYKEYHHG